MFLARSNFVCIYNQLKFQKLTLCFIKSENKLALNIKKKKYKYLIKHFIVMWREVSVVKEIV